MSAANTAVTEKLSKELALERLRAAWHAPQLEFVVPYKGIHGEFPAEIYMPQIFAETVPSIPKFKDIFVEATDIMVNSVGQGVQYIIKTQASLTKFEKYLETLPKSLSEMLSDSTKSMHNMLAQRQLNGGATFQSGPLAHLPSLTGLKFPPNPNPHPLSGMPSMPDLSSMFSSLSASGATVPPAASNSSAAANQLLASFTTTVSSGATQLMSALQNPMMTTSFAAMQSAQPSLSAIATSPATPSASVNTTASANVNATASATVSAAIASTGASSATTATPNKPAVK